MLTEMNKNKDVTLREALKEITDRLGDEINEILRSLDEANIDSDDPERTCAEWEIECLMMPYLYGNRWTKMVIKVTSIIKATLAAFAAYFDDEGFRSYEVITNPEGKASEFMLYTASNLPTIKFDIEAIRDGKSNVVFIYNMCSNATYPHHVLFDEFTLCSLVDDIIQATAIGIWFSICDLEIHRPAVSDIIFNTKMWLFEKAIDYQPVDEDDIGYDYDEEDDEYDD